MNFYLLVHLYSWTQNSLLNYDSWDTKLGGFLLHYSQNYHQYDEFEEEPYL